ncbi:MAG: exodeoxyribonuclease V subunit alpha [Desulfobacterales bacterium]|nr:exodeoxyribonuclease V subunit alpha [Desulfobacterales bacterium]
METFTDHIRHLHAGNLLQDIDLKFAGLMMALSGSDASEELALAAALVSNTTAGEKHICFDLEAGADRPLADLFSEVPEKMVARLQRARTPDTDAWTAKLKASQVVGAPGKYRPLVLDEKNRLYLYRYWDYEHTLAQAIQDRTGALRLPVDADTLRSGLKRYFPSREQTPNWQKVAAYAAVTGKLCIISGGPGTGKTHTVTHILALLLEQDENLRIAVCAPTGKAAARVQESIKKATQALDCPSVVRHKIPEEATTIHRLMGVKRNSPHFYHDHRNRLPVDVLIVDEASMVSLALMTKLLRATSPKCRIILLGDRNQLASVEAGAVLGDICNAADTRRFSKSFCEQYADIGLEELPTDCAVSNAALADCTVELKFSYRFDETSAIAAVSRAVNNGDAAASVEIMDAETTGTIAKRPLPDPGELETYLPALIEAGYAGIYEAQDVSEAFAALETFRILCTHRRGPYGIDGINRLIETILQKKGLVDTTGAYYPGRPIMINRNDYNLRLYNGDVGIIWPDDTGRPRAWFPDQMGGFLNLAPARLPAHETVYAMTIHKSQGSEFDRIVMILSATASPIFTRELVYTGITRARRQVEIWAADDIFKAAVKARVERRSGLQDGLQAQLQQP